ncbi:MAG: MotA/TolQ/ExbB proton channel family protein, partial [Bdellovibrionales bacterium]|nr:MotA/TolQ/ExbB proton channel family protein [Bdellovibrionales bacterium]NQZ19884.1 MotA/TolQ/ExbB proton channel family protein [Bdellovibrionales bacterium]
MKALICNIIVLLLVSPVWAQEEVKAKPQVDELTQAYQREILFLSTYKRELQNKLSGVDKSLGKKLKMAQVNLKQLESRWLKKQTDNELLMQKLTDIERDYEFKKENKSLIETTIKQAQMAQNKTQEKTEEEVPLIQQIDKLLSASIGQLESSDKIRKEPGAFYTKNGEQQQGQLIFVGGIARFAESNGTMAALYPSGGGTFKVWKWLSAESMALSSKQIPKTLEFFLFDNPDKEFVARKDKTTLEVIQSGGLIGWIIVAMGLLALIMSGIRYMLLRRARSKSPKSLELVISSIQKNDIEEAQSILLTQNNSVNRVVGKTLSFLKKDPKKVDDAIIEGILQESQMIDRFGVFILVIASVAPLMGLLGTVTGMISTFDIITLYGTGNPKLLSGGI